MSNPYVGEIRMFGGNFAPAGWAFCDGALLAIAEFETLFNLIGTTYGGDGQSTFQLPDLQGRVPIHVGGGFTIGETGGVESVTLTTQQIPAHSHLAVGTSSGGSQTSPANAVWAQTPELVYHEAPTTGSMAADSLSIVGGSQPHDNMLPFLAVSFIISLFGIFPSQT